jgi:transposase
MIIKHVTGIDVSKDKLAVVFGTLKADQEHIITHSIEVANDIKGFKQILTFVKKNRGSSKAPLYFVMEATGVYYENLAYFLSDQQLQVAVILPNKTKNFSKTLDIKSKTDRLDARKLTQYGLEKKINLWKVPSTSIKALKALTRERRSIMNMIVQVKNQIHAKNYSHQPMKESIKRSKDVLNVLKKQVKEIEKQIKEFLTKDPDLAEKVKKMDKIKGLGIISIASIIAETDGFALIKNAKQLTSYAGLDVVHNESGIKKGKTTISKKGNVHLRSAVYMPALCACRYNPKFKQLYLRLIARKEFKKIGIVAVARKLLILAYLIFTRDMEYVNNYSPANAGNIR